MASTELVETVVLRTGPVALTALQLLWDLETREFTISVVEDTLRVSPRSRITPADDAAIRQHRDELIAFGPRHMRGPAMAQSVAVKEHRASQSSRPQIERRKRTAK